MAGGGPKEDRQSGVRSHGRRPWHPEPAARAQPCLHLAGGRLGFWDLRFLTCKMGRTIPPLGPFTFSEMMQCLAGVGGGPAQSEPRLADGGAFGKPATGGGRHHVPLGQRQMCREAAAGAGSPHPPQNARTTSVSYFSPKDLTSLLTAHHGRNQTTQAQRNQPDTKDERRTVACRGPQKRQDRETEQLRYRGRKGFSFHGDRAAVWGDERVWNYLAAMAAQHHEGT